MKNRNGEAGLRGEIAHEINTDKEMDTVRNRYHAFSGSHFTTEDLFMVSNCLENK